MRDANFVEKVLNTVNRVITQYMLPVYNIENINNIDKTAVQFTINDQLFFETLMMEIRATTISYATFKKRQSDNRERELVKKIEDLEKLLSGNNDLLTEIEENRSELEKIRKHKMDGVRIRSKVRWLEEGEKVTKYFCHLENRNFICKTMNKIINKDGIELTETQEIVQETKLFYENLYSSREDNITDIDLNNLIKNSIPKLSTEEKGSIEGKISMSEASFSLKKMANEKSPGTSGYSAEFYKFFWKDIGVFLVRAINFGFFTKSLSSTQKQGLITCLPKGKKPKQFLKNWRPISLLNVEYKIASACIAERIKKFLPKIIDEDQKGFVKGRFIGENIRILYDIMFYLEQQKQSGMILLLDFEKAFDSLSWSFIMKVLKYFNFGTDIQNWVETFYKDIVSCVQVNGHVSDWFNINRGCRQGDPLSPYIFIMCDEILAILSRQNKRVRGIQVNNLEYLISQYADDTTFTLNDSRESLEECLKLLKLFSEISGLCINIEKSKVIWIGKKKHSATRFCPEYNLEWNPDIFTVLGVKFKVNLHEMIELNYSEKIQDIKTLFSQWEKRKISPLGKIVVIKSLALSKLNHLFSSLPSPAEEIINKVNRLFYNYLWDGKPDKIRRKVVSQDYALGGLRMIDVKCFIQAIKLSWIRRLLSGFSKLQHLQATLCRDLHLSYSGISFTKHKLKMKKIFFGKIF